MQEERDAAGDSAAPAGDCDDDINNTVLLSAELTAELEGMTGKSHHPQTTITTCLT